jgi:hypothetical protein
MTKQQLEQAIREYCLEVLGITDHVDLDIIATDAMQLIYRNGLSMRPNQLRNSAITFSRTSDGTYTRTT